MYMFNNYYGRIEALLAKTLLACMKMCSIFDYGGAFLQAVRILSMRMLA